MKNSLALILSILAFGLDGQSEWETFTMSTLGRFESDCVGNLYVYRNGDILKYDGSWNQFNYETIDTNCTIEGLIINPMTCELWGYDDERDCNFLFTINDTTVRQADVLKTSGVRSISFDEDNNVYVSATVECYWIDDGGRTHNIDTPLGSTEKIHYATDNSLWILGQNGSPAQIARLKDEEWTLWTDSELPIQSLHKYWLYEDNFENIWLNVDQDFLLKYNGEIWEQIEMEFLNADNFKDLIQDYSNSYWVSSNIGLVQWDGQNDYTIYDVTNSDILSTFCGLLETANDSILWIQHSSGFSKMKIDGITSSTKDTQKPNTNHSQFSLYPNPTHSSFTLSFPHIEQRQVEIFNTTGQLVYTKQTNDLSLEVSSLASNVFKAGCYWVRVSGASGEAVEKVILY